MEMKHYYGIDWLRTGACLGIVMMHMLSKANNSYELKGYVAGQIIPSFTNFVFLFMVISAFGMCVGYYEKVKSGNINWVDFYKKRYMKVLPFLFVVVMADIIVNHNITSLIEAVPNLTLTRGFFPNNIGQIGVAWFLGVIFVFYAIFPLFCCMINTKKSAWIFFTLSILLNYIVDRHYDVGRTNIIYCLPFFIAGGLIYLYRKELQNIKWPVMLAITIFFIVVYYIVKENVYICLLISAAVLIQAINSNVGCNKCLSFFSGLSMEIYLSHMLMFRVVEKLQLNTILGNGWTQYILTVILVFTGATLFAYVVKKFFAEMEHRMVRKV